MHWLVQDKSCGAVVVQAYRSCCFFNVALLGEIMLSMTEAVCFPLRILKARTWLGSGSMATQDIPDLSIPWELLLGRGVDQLYTLWVCVVLGTLLATTTFTQCSL